MKQWLIDRNNQFWQWLISLFVEEYELTIWFHSETQITDRGTKTVKRSEPKTWHLRKIKKLTQTQVIAEEWDGTRLEIRVKEKFDYNVRKIR